LELAVGAKLIEGEDVLVASAASVIGGVDDGEVGLVAVVGLEEGTG
jgi:hypothetical protein